MTKEKNDKPLPDPGSPRYRMLMLARKYDQQKREEVQAGSDSDGAKDWMDRV